MAEVKRTITRRAERVMNDLDGDFKGLISDLEFKAFIPLLTENPKGSESASIKAKLIRMFRACGIECEPDRESRYYVDLIHHSPLLTPEQIYNKMLCVLFNKYKYFPSPENYLLRIVDRMSSPEDQWQNDTLRTRILKQFIKYGNYLSDVYIGSKKIGGKNSIKRYVKAKTGAAPSLEDVISYTDDHVFDCLENAAENQKAPEGTFGLLKIVDDLAAGRFREGGSTKRILYLFAMVYDMTYNKGELPRTATKLFDTDIEQNLFRDFYTNNLIRFITHYNMGVTGVESDPSGIGINYKNFAEAVYIYYISRDMKPQEKIKRSADMIRRLTENAAPQQQALPKRNTQIYKTEFIDDVLSFDEAAFEEYIRNNYNCCTTYINSNQKSVTVSPLQLETNQETAFKTYQKITEELGKIANESGSPNPSEKENCYGLWFVDLNRFSSKNYRIPSFVSEADKDKFEEFQELLRKMNSYVANANPGAKKIRVFEVGSSANITRTSLLVAYYYLFNIKADYAERPETRPSFKEYFKKFKEEIDKHFLDAGYQTLSGKNIFDVLIVFSSYTYIYF